MARLLPAVARPGHGMQALRLAPWVRRFQPRLVCVPMGIGGFDAVAGRPHATQISTVNAQRSMTRVGPAWNFTGINNGGGLTFNARTPMVGLGWSMVSVCRYRGAGENGLGRLFTGLARDLYPAGTNRVEFMTSFTGGYLATTFSYQSDGVFRNLVITHDASVVNLVPRAWWDGVEDLSTSVSNPSSGTYNAAPATQLSIGNASVNNARCMDGEVALAAFFDTVLPPSIARALSVNPWLIFAP